VLFSQIPNQAAHCFTSNAGDCCPYIAIYRTLTTFLSQPQDMHKLRSDDPPAYERAVKRAQFNDWSLKLKSKTEEYNGESRRRLTVVHCGKPDYAVEAKHLLSLIQGVSA
jgi:hypothetical protein